MILSKNRSKDETKSKKDVLLRKLMWFRDQIKPTTGDNNEMTNVDTTAAVVVECELHKKETLTLDEIKSLIEQ